MFSKIGLGNKEAKEYLKNLHKNIFCFNHPETNETLLWFRVLKCRAEIFK